MEEIWRDIQGYEGFYQVSNMGNVKSVERLVKHFLYGERFACSQILKPAKNNRGYLCVSLWKDGKGVSKTVHRLVLNTFIPNINNKPEINHLDGNKENNVITNLEWSSISENRKHAYNNKLKLPSNEKRVIQKNLIGNVINIFNSMCEAERITGIPKEEISKVCNRYRNRKIAKGFKWEFEGDPRK
jgi:hypothetical protein